MIHLNVFGSKPHIHLIVGTMTFGLCIDVLALLTPAVSQVRFSMRAAEYTEMVEQKQSYRLDA